MPTKTQDKPVKSAKSTQKVKPAPFSALEAADGEKQVQVQTVPETSQAEAKPQKPRNIAEILSQSKKLRIQQTQAEFEESLDLMSMAELQDLSYEKRLMPNGNAAKMKAALVGEFIKERTFGDNARKVINPFENLKKGSQFEQISF
jgi:hypothetical protein